MMKLKTLLACGALAASSAAMATGNYTNSFDTVSADSAAAALKNNSSIGLGVASFDQLYRGLDRKTTAVPLFDIKYNRFFLKGFDLGFNAYQNEKLTASIVLKPMFNGYKAEDSNDLTGMEDREMSAYLGGQLTYRMRPLNFTFFAAQDVTGRTEGNISGVKVGMGLPIMDGKVIVAPSVSATLWSDDVVNYYYGVKTSEATNTRAAYSPDSTWVYNGTISAMYRFKTNWMARLTYSYSFYGDEVDNSPITDRQTVNTVLAGVSYLF